jgi:hypothetical protein
MISGDDRWHVMWIQAPTEEEKAEGTTAVWGFDDFASKGEAMALVESLQAKDDVSFVKVHYRPPNLFVFEWRR